MSEVEKIIKLDMYEQYTALEIVDVSKESLIEWGVYPNKKENKPGNF